MCAKSPRFTADSPSGSVICPRAQSFRQPTLIYKYAVNAEITKMSSKACFCCASYGYAGCSVGSRQFSLVSVPVLLPVSSLAAPRASAPGPSPVPPIPCAAPRSLSVSEPPLQEPLPVQQSSSLVPSPVVVPFNTSQALDSSSGRPIPSLLRPDH
jgi:hypothetical protein